MSNTYKLGQLYEMSNPDDQQVMDERDAKLEQILALIDGRLTANEAQIAIHKAALGLDE